MPSGAVVGVIMKGGSFELLTSRAFCETKTASLMYYRGVVHPEVILPLGCIKYFLMH